MSHHCLQRLIGCSSTEATHFVQRNARMLQFSRRRLRGRVENLEGVLRATSKQVRLLQLQRNVCLSLLALRMATPMLQ